MKSVRRISCLVMALFFVLATPLQALAVEVGDFNLTLTDGGGDPTKDTDYTFESNTLTIISGTAMTVSNKADVPTATDNIVINAGDSTANVTLNNVNISTSGSSGVAAVEVKGEAEVTLVGNNTVTSGSDAAGVEVETGAELTITEDSTGSLSTTGGSNAAGIGGGNGGSGGTISIQGGTIDADGGDGGAGVGGGNGGSGGTITISGDAYVDAHGEGGGAGIGGGNKGSSGAINIMGGTVKTTASGYGAGIGSGYESTSSAGDKISISGENTDVDARGVSQAAAIGSGAMSEGCKIEISGGKVFAWATSGGAGIGIGHGGSGGEVLISGGYVEAKGGRSGMLARYCGAGIGGGYNTDGIPVTITGGTVIATGGATFSSYGGTGGAGIGGGQNANGGDVDIQGGYVEATGASGAAGIGGGQGGSGNKTTISGGTVIATGGDGSAYYSSGEGISGKVIITDGSVEAEAGTPHEDYTGEPAVGIVDTTYITGGKVTIDHESYDIPDQPPQSGSDPAPQPSFWEIVSQKIRQSEDGSEFVVEAGNITYIPRTVLELAREKNITLVIKWNGGEDITIAPTDEIDLTTWKVDFKDLV